MKFLVLFLTVFIVSCGGGTPQHSQKAEIFTDTIAIYSDSTGVGVDGGALVAGACPPTHCPIVARNWPSYIDVPGYKVINHSVGGLSALDLFKGRPELNVKPWYEIMAASNDRIVVIALAINDAGTSPPAEYANILERLIGEAQTKPGRIVVLQTPNPTGRTDTQAISQAMADIAEKRKTHLIDQNKHGFEWLSMSLELAVPDKIHPIQTVYTEMGRYANEKLNALLK